MTIAKFARFFFAVLSIVCEPSGFGQGPAQSSPRNPTLTPRGIVDVGPPEEYLLGPDDQVKIWALGMGEIPATPQRIDPAGYVDLPVLGRIRAAGLSLSQFKEALLASLANTEQTLRIGEGRIAGTGLRLVVAKAA